MTEARVNGHTPVCSEEWEAPRKDAPLSVDVRHVCTLAWNHEGRCECSCGAARP